MPINKNNQQFVCTDFAHSPKVFASLMEDEWELKSWEKVKKQGHPLYICGLFERK